MKHNRRSRERLLTGPARASFLKAGKRAAFPFRCVVSTLLESDMSKPLSPAAFLALMAIANHSATRADTPPRSQVTIRGTGTNVRLEATGAPIRKRSLQKRLVSAGALDDAIALKAAGADDSTVLAHLRVHQGELPVVIGAEDVQQLRKAGAGKSVFAYLATVSAVDIGPTGEGRESTTPSQPPPAFEMPPYETPYDYSLGVGYGASYAGRFAPRQRFASPRVFFHHGHLISRRAFPPHAVPTRRSMM